MKTVDWLYQYRKKIIVAILAVLTFSIAVTMVFIAMTLRNRLIEDSKRKTHELGVVIRSSLSHLMLARDPGRIQNTLVMIGKNESSVLKAFILDKNGKVAYSSEEKEIGAVIDRFRETSCKGCHRGPVTVPHDTTMVLTIGSETVLRNVNIIYNEKPCHGCHAPSDRINGKLIIDRSIKPTYSLIAAVGMIIMVSGLIVIIFLVPFLWRVLSRGLDKYINEILVTSTELELLYKIVERLSKTIDMEELKQIVVEIVGSALNADEIDIILKKDAREYAAIGWTRAENKLHRRRIEPGDQLHHCIDRWLNDEMSRETVTQDRTGVCMPITKGDNKYALIIVRKIEGLFDAGRLGILRALSSHIAVAFENAMLYHIAITDELTGLYTRRHFRHAMEKKFALFEGFGEKLTLLMIDIDNFKPVNDTYGHPAGDEVLRDVARCIMDSTRNEDISFRYGGEEFAVILPATDSAGGMHVAERIRKTIEGTVFHAGGTEILVTVSIGLASCPEHANSIRDIILEADKSLYQAKRAGKNKVMATSSRVQA